VRPLEKTENLFFLIHFFPWCEPTGGKVEPGANLTTSEFTATTPAF
jgi:hypothetical protein